MSWIIDKMDGQILFKDETNIRINKKDVYDTLEGDAIYIDVELVKYTCPLCKEEKFSLTINGSTVYGGSGCSVRKGKETYSCVGCAVKISE